MYTADVVLLCSDQTVLKAHKCILSISPVLKEVLLCVDSRRDKVAHISMESFEKEDVQSFLHFPPVLRHKKTLGEFVNIGRTKAFEIKLQCSLVREGV